jgi:hypothetical protein
VAVAAAAALLLPRFRRPEAASPAAEPVAELAQVR